MADVPINAVDRRKQFTGNTGTGPFSFTFEILASSDIAVFKNDTLLTEGTGADYTVTIAANGTGSVTLTGSNNGTALVATDFLTIVGGRALARTTDFVTAGDLLASSLNEQLDSNVIMVQQLDEKAERTLRISQSDVTADMTIPNRDTRKGKYLAFNSTTGLPEAGPSTTDVNTLASVTGDIATLADIEDGTDATDAIQTVAGIASNVTTVAGIGSSNITTVAGKAAEIGRLGTTAAVADLAILGTTAVVADMDTLADVSADITTLAHIEDGTTASNAIQTVATNISSVQSAQANATAAEAARDAAKAIAAAMGAALDNFDDRYLGTMADTKTAVTSKTPTITTTNGSADITVDNATGIIVGMKVTSANIPTGTNVIGISGTTISLDNAATAAASGTSSTFSAHGVFGAFNTSTDGPSTDNDGDSLVTGSLYFNTTDNEMRVYDGANWIAASAAGSASMNIFEYTVSGSPTATFSGTDDNGATLSYTQQNIQVVKDGVVLHADDFTANNGTSVVLQSNAAVGSEIVIYAFKSFTVADTVSKSSGGTFSSNVTVTGTLNATTDVQVNGASVATMGKSIAMAIVFGG